MFTKLLLSCCAIVAFSFTVAAQSSVTIKDANGRTLVPIDLQAQRQIEQQKYPSLTTKPEANCVKLTPEQALVKVVKNIEECERTLANTQDLAMMKKYESALAELRAHKVELEEIAAKK